MEKQTNKLGRPTLYKDEYSEQAYKLCLLGATNEDLAKFFSVAVSTIHEWRNNHDLFSDAIKKGKEEADALVASRLFTRAIGFKSRELKVNKVVGALGKEKVSEKTETIKEIAPDTTACIFWLKNRQPDKWRDKQHVESTNDYKHEINITRKIIEAENKDD